MRTPIFAITDGETRVNLISKSGSGINVLDYKPARQDAKNGGVWADSSLSDGRQLKVRKLSNAVDVLTLGISGINQDRVIESARNLTELLEKAVSYWTSDWQDEPVWLERRGSSESNSVFTLINSYRWENDNDPFAPPFNTPSKPSAQVIDLAIEHGPWLANLPGDRESVEISNITSGSSLQDDSEPIADDDDAYIDPTAITVVSPFLSVRRSHGGDNVIGVRFIDVAIPPNAKILAAALEFRNFYSNVGVGWTKLQTKITAEANVAPAAFTTRANFVGRTKTTASVIWNMQNWWRGSLARTIDIGTVVQEVVDLAGWTSGNDMVFFVEPHANTGQSTFASFENTEYAAPKLVIYYSAERDIGRDFTEDNEVYVANKDIQTQLTHIYTYDDSAAAFSANLVDQTSFSLLPDPIGVDDIVYFGAYSSSELFASPFSSLVFDIDDTAGATTITWQYWNGAAWAALTTVTDVDNYEGLGVEGVGCVAWLQPLTWAKTTINGVELYWIRAIVTAAGDVPTQQNRVVYTVTRSSVDVEVLGGDIPAVGTIQCLHTNATGANVKKGIVAMRSVSRGANFSPYINAGLQNRPLVTLTGGVLFLESTATPTGLLRIAAPVTAGFLSQWAATLEVPLAQEYYGKYRAFSRIYDNGTLPFAEGEISSYLEVTMGTTRSTKTVANVETRTDYYYFDYGVLDLPPAVVPKTYEGAIKIEVFAETQRGTDATVSWIDLILIPVDEYVLEYNQVPTSNEGDFTILDSTTYMGKGNIFSILRKSDDFEIHDVPNVLAPAPIHLQANEEQRVFFFVIEDCTYEWIGKIQIGVNKRYLTFRGDNDS